ncbi:GntR family transcriptional regulator [Pseudoalteromonas sp. NBT06-2]|uniref:GntR family transcriptional regulator n=1 Tax=Pseudoalteromonas sp. NBT06-2 TaxID=2025950 RepID=UPI000BA4E93D|nr:GntR family transcriptional regulator [Pseudoalteromonas sp. NBT06-2]PAJ74928.1 GntR family transcriptional regulator [Pseudoalteromonas sp. NBT06-2]
MSAVKKMEYKTLTQLVTESVREKILSGEIAVGTHIRQATLAKELNVSQIPVREALLLLEGEGLITFRANKGASVTDFNLEQVDELFLLRATLEAQLLASSIANLSKEKLEQASCILDNLDNALKSNNAPKVWCDLNTDYHTCLYSAADLPQTQELVNILNTKAERYVRVHINSLGGVIKVGTDHKDILNACINGDTEQAVKILKQHIFSSRDEIKEVLRQA